MAQPKRSLILGIPSPDRRGNPFVKLLAEQKIEADSRKKLLKINGKIIKISGT